ncbi:hypothetical protein KAF25_004127, partial [Fusarium avenaceum]
SAPMDSSQGPRNDMPTMATELSDSSWQRASRRISSLAKRTGRKFSSLRNTKTRPADQHNPRVVARLFRGHPSTNDFDARHKSIEVATPNKKKDHAASLATTFEEQRRGMLSFQDPSVMVGAGRISTRTTELGWLPDNEYERKPGTARKISTIMSDMHKIIVRLPDSKILLDHPYQDQYPPPYLRLSRTPRDSPTRDPNDTSRAANQSSLPNKESRNATSATQELDTNDLVSSLYATETDSSRTNRSEISTSGPSSSATSTEEDTPGSSASATDASDATDYTDLSLIETFESSAVPSNVALLSALLSIKDEVVLRIVKMARLTTAPAQGVRQHISDKAQATQSISQDSRTNSSKNSSHRHLPNVRKRLLDSDEEGYNAGDDESELIDHTRAEQRCDNQSAPEEEEIIFISQTQEKALRKRHRNIPEDERWVLVFQILFPDIPTDHIPSPYYKLDPSDLGPDLATLDEFRAFVVEELPSRIIDDVNNHLRYLPGVAIMGDQITSILRDTIHDVMEGFLQVPTSQGPRQITSLPIGVSSGTDLGEMSTLTTGNISAIPLDPFDISSMCHPSWLADMPSPDPGSINLYAEPSAVLSQDLGLQPSFMMMGSDPITSALGTEPSIGGHIGREDLQDGKRLDGLSDFPHSSEFF